MPPPSCTVAVIYRGGQAGGLHAKARYPQGRIQKAWKHCILSGAVSVETVKARIRNYVILGGMYGQMVVKCKLGSMRECYFWGPTTRP